MLNELIQRYPALEPIKEELQKAADLMETTVKNGGKILVCGNGGSCADGDHIVGELMKGFLSLRPINNEFTQKLKELYPDEYEFLKSNLQEAIPAISLNSHPALTSAFNNDVDASMTYAQLAYGYGNEGDLLIGISTSGNSKNVVYAAQAAKALGCNVISLVGEKPCKLGSLSNVTVHAPHCETYRIQELHLPIYHYLCASAEDHFFKE